MTPEASLRLLDLPDAIPRRWIGQLNEPQRHYHTLTHIAAMLGHVPWGEASRELIAAIWLHDIVYDPRAADNEERSAMQALADLGGSGIDATLVADLVRGTRHHEAGSGLQNLLNDLDLTILGTPAPVYADYARRIRLEYAFVWEDVYRPNRARLLRKFDARQIYRTEPFGGLEAQAHRNLAWEILELER
jgi:predicted metal-dependent HD superfamily phosphohydrolase